MEPTNIVVITVFILMFGLISRRIERSLITPPMIFAGFGVVLALLNLGPGGLTRESELVTVTAEITLILVLFSDAARINLRLLVREQSIPIRLLAFGLPLTIALGTGIGIPLLPGFSIWEVAILATILAPTDAALAQAVINLPGVPARVRQSLNVESGLNDGIALPVLLLFISLAGAEGEGGSAAYWAQFTALQLIMGPIIGAAIGLIGGRGARAAHQRGWMSDSFLHLSGLALALMAYALAEVLGGNGFIAAFVAGIALGNAVPQICHPIQEFVEDEGQLLILFTFTLFGLTMVPAAFAELPMIPMLALVYAPLSLTVIRMVPVAISLVGARLQRETVLFLGWFGPRGVASILYALILLEEESVPNAEPIFAIAMFTVLCSIVAHGLTAIPFSERYARHIEAMGDEMVDSPEAMPVTEMPQRMSYTME